ncbi:hypothetical protein G6F55_003711 [Rhizopus delemar]|uniref:Gti1/Pac2 family protein n=2 Tax=Rhizopus TaxID=4842 RepID=A0A9P6ZC22_9FUNG|nr:hypothetical protein G6F55_003711 [Rhizopus delemar]KAG1549222.1 hypothetical protein G6F51_003190 [Rhizopus arrhizus]KAG1526022.1 hypothetical protein G6F52_002806 [Rhizopus delemar]KAG1560595.1 hypothetical protein G6F49_002553 [Rhizopus delemar]KAG1574703.1 hypothetical protein G6F50_001734 [Rhizopus delemar]
MTITETYHGFIETTTDTLLIFEACRQGVLPKINRRLQERERGVIKSGTVIVFDEKESGIKRWTDGLIWSPSRILGNFLIYRELEGREMLDEKTSNMLSTNGLQYNEEYKTNNRERALVGSLTDTYKFKKGGLIKKTLSIQVNGSSQHLISYYTKEDVLSGKLATPSSIPQIASFQISPDLFMQQNFRIPLSLEYSEFSYRKGLDPCSPTDSVSSRRKSFALLLENVHPYAHSHTSYYSRRRVSSGDLYPSTEKVSTIEKSNSGCRNSKIANAKYSSYKSTSSPVISILSPTSFQCSPVYQSDTSYLEPNFSIIDSEAKSQEHITFPSTKENNTSSWLHLSKYATISHQKSSSDKETSPLMQYAGPIVNNSKNARNFASFEAIDTIEIQNHAFFHQEQGKACHGTNYY